MADRMLTHDGITKTLSAWATERNMGRATLYTRLYLRGWSVARALTTPVTPAKRRGGRRKAGAPRPVPALKCHPSGRAYCRWRSLGKTLERYFGAWGSKEALAAYGLFAAEWAITGAPTATEAVGLSVAALVVKWMEHAGQHYVKDGKQTSAYAVSLSVCRTLNDLYGATLAAEFAPVNLRVIRQAWIDARHSRRTCNDYTSTVVRMFGWAAGQSLVPAAVVAALREVEALQAGRTTARDNAPRRAVTDEQIAATLPHLSPDPERRAKLAAMVALQRYTGMRPGEVCALSPVDIERLDGGVWRYTVARPKNLHKGKTQRYYLGPRAVAVLAPYLAGDPSRPVFDYRPNTYTQAVAYASNKSGAGHWTPHQLRHALATEVAEEFRSLDHAAAAIGDTRAVAEAVYVHVDPDELRRIEVAKRMG